MGRIAGCKQFGDQSDRQTDHIKIAAFYARNPPCGASLDGVGAGLVHRLAGRYVCVNLFAGQCEEGDGSSFGHSFSALGGNNGDAGKNAVCAP